MVNLNQNSNLDDSYIAQLNKKRYRKSKKSQSRVFVEAIIMIFVGVNLILFLNSIPDRFIWNEFANEAWLNLTQGLIQLGEALIKIGAAVSVVFLILLSLLLITGGTIRLLRIIFNQNINLKRSKGKPLFKSR